MGAVKNYLIQHVEDLRKNCDALEHAVFEKYDPVAMKHALDEMTRLAKELEPFFSSERRHA